MPNKVEVKHGGCYNCGNDQQPVLKSVIRPVINIKGMRDTSTMGLALCNSCLPIEVIDQRIAAASNRPR